MPLLEFMKQFFFFFILKFVFHDYYTSISKNNQVYAKSHLKCDLLECDIRVRWLHCIVWAYINCTQMTCVSISCSWISLVGSSSNHNLETCVHLYLCICRHVLVFITIRTVLFINYNVIRLNG